MGEGEEGQGLRIKRSQYLVVFFRWSAQVDSLKWILEGLLRGADRGGGGWIGRVLEVEVGEEVEEVERLRRKCMERTGR